MDGESSEVGNREKRGAVTTKNGCREEGQGTRRTESQELIHEGDKNARRQPTVQVVRTRVGGIPRTPKAAFSREGINEGRLVLEKRSRQYGTNDKDTEGRYSQGGRKPVLSSLRERGREEGVTPPLSPETRNKIREMRRRSNSSTVSRNAKQDPRDRGKHPRLAST